MLNAHVPTILALLGTVLMAIVIFAPAPARATVTASLAPPLRARADDLGEPRRDDAPLDGFRGRSPDDAYAAWQSFLTDGCTAETGLSVSPDPSPVDPSAVDPSAVDPSAGLGEDVPLAQWPALVDPRAARCDPAARMAIVAALAEVGTPWSGGVLRIALEDERHPDVRAALADAVAHAPRAESSAHPVRSAKPLTGSGV